MWKRDWCLCVEECLKFYSVRGSEGVQKLSRECSQAVKDSNIMVAITADTVATVGMCALAAIIASAFRASCSSSVAIKSNWILSLYH